MNILYVVHRLFVLPSFLANRSQGADAGAGDVDEVGHGTQNYAGLRYGDSFRCGSTQCNWNRKNAGDTILKPSSTDRTAGSGSTIALQNPVTWCVFVPRCRHCNLQKMPCFFLFFFQRRWYGVCLYVYTKKNSSTLFLWTVDYSVFFFLNFTIQTVDLDLRIPAIEQFLVKTTWLLEVRFDSPGLVETFRFWVVVFSVFGEFFQGLG